MRFLFKLVRLFIYCPRRHSRSIQLSRFSGSIQIGKPIYMLSVGPTIRWTLKVHSTFLNFKTHTSLHQMISFLDFANFYSVFEVWYLDVPRPRKR